jgi:hypothetical protein
LPKSDCGHFICGVLTGEEIEEMIADGAPRCGIVVWYTDPNRMRAAMKAITDAHWPSEVKA